MQNNTTTIHKPTNKMKTLSMFATCLTLLLAFTGCDRFGPGESKTTLGTHTVTIVNSGEKPYGGTSGIVTDGTAGTTIHSFKSANGLYMIELENEDLTINGVNYTLEKPGSEIRITEDGVEINGAKAIPDKE